MGRPEVRAPARDVARERGVLPLPEDSIDPPLDPMTRPHCLLTLFLATSGTLAHAQFGVGYCTVTPNSTGAASVLAAHGSTDVARNDLRLQCDQLPPQAPGYLLVSRERGFFAQPTASTGNICLGGSIGRFSGAVRVASSAGRVELALDLTSIPSVAGPFAVTNGGTLHFQWWHRDAAAGGGATSNFSAPLSLTFCPRGLYPEALYDVDGIVGSIAAADVDGDGDIDLVAVSGTEGTLCVFRNLGNGEFAPRSTFQLGLPLALLELGDIDADGDMDAVTIDFALSRFHVARNDGAGDFSAATAVASAGFLQGLALGDVDGDGALDIAAARPLENAIVWHRNLGGGAFGGPLVVPCDAGPRDVAIGDLDGDGDGDFAVSSDTVATRVLLNIGGAFVPHAEVGGSGGGRAVTLVDLEGDGDLDTLTIAPFHEVRIGTNDGTGLVVGTAVLTSVGPWDEVDAADVDDDGVLDIVAGGAQSESFTTFRGLGGLAYGAPVATTTAAGAGDFALADFDGDGTPDVGLCGGGGFAVGVVLNLGDGTFFAQQRSNGPAVPATELALGDLDGDGDLDVVDARSNGTVGIRRGDGTGAFQLQPGVPVAGNLTDLAVGDLDGDLDLDVAVLQRAPLSRLAVLENMGDGTLALPVAYATAAEPWALALGDADSDGDLDVVVACILGDVVSVHENDGFAHFGARTDIGSMFRPGAVAVQDFDADGDLDVLASTLGGTVRVFLGDGLGQFVPGATREVGQLGFTSIAVADLTGDGAPDIALAGLLDDDAVVVPNDGTGGLAASMRIAGVPDPWSVDAGDLDGDGAIDLVFGSEGPFSRATVLRSLGRGAFAPVLAFGTEIDTQDVAVGDVDGDGRLDVVSVSSFSGEAIVLRNLCR